MTATEKALLPVPNDDEARALAQRLMPQFPKDLTNEQALEVARVALAYGLDPFLGELIPYQGRPYLTFDGRIRIADRHPAYDGYDLVPVTGEELDALRPQQGESIWKCVVYRKDRSRPTIAYGRAGGPHEKNPLAKQDPVTMAQKRAIHRALRAAFPVPIPGVEVEITDGQVRAIHAIDEELGISREERRQVLSETFGVESSRDLTADQASSYIDMRITEQPPTEAETGEQAGPPPGSVEDWAARIEATTSIVDLEELGRAIRAATLNKEDRAALTPIYRRRRGEIMIEDLADEYGVETSEVVDIARRIGITRTTDLNEKNVDGLRTAVESYAEGGRTGALAEPETDEVEGAYEEIAGSDGAAPAAGPDDGLPF